MTPTSRPVLVRNLANIVSIVGVLPICLLFVESGYRYLIPILIFNNIMDDLDGIVAARLKISSAFGAALDNVCDAVAHVSLVLAVGMRQDGICAALSLLAVVAILVRVVSRLIPGHTPGVGSPTNELMRHMLLALLLAAQFDVSPGWILSLVFVAHAFSLVLPYRMPGLIRSMTKSVFAVALVNVSLIVAWLLPMAAPVVAAAFGLTYIYGFVVGGMMWVSDRPRA